MRLCVSCPAAASPLRADADVWFGHQGGGLLFLFAAGSTAEDITLCGYGLAVYFRCILVIINRFSSYWNGTFVCVGTAKDHNVTPRFALFSCRVDKSFLLIYLLLRARAV